MKPVTREEYDFLLQINGIMFRLFLAMNSDRMAEIEAMLETSIQQRKPAVEQPEQDPWLVGANTLLGIVQRMRTPPGATSRPDWLRGVFDGGEG